MRLTFENITIGYGSDRAILENISTSLGEGLWVVTGPNGSGKSSLLRCAASIIRPRSGRLTYDGADVWGDPMAYRWRVGYAPQDVDELPDLTTRRYLTYLAALKGVRSTHQRERVAEMLASCNLPDQLMRTLSTGMKRRLAIAAALLNDPDVLLLDEPADGLDPEERIWLYRWLSDLAGSRVAVLATNLPDEVAGVTDGWVHIQKGVLAHRH